MSYLLRRWMRIYQWYWQRMVKHIGARDFLMLVGIVRTIRPDFSLSSSPLKLTTGNWKIRLWKARWWSSSTSVSKPDPNIHLTRSMLVFSGLCVLAMLGLPFASGMHFLQRRAKAGKREAVRDVNQHWQTKDDWKQSSKSPFPLICAIHHHTMCITYIIVRTHTVYIYIFMYIDIVCIYIYINIYSSPSKNRFLVIVFQPCEKRHRHRYKKKNCPNLQGWILAAGTVDGHLLLWKEFPGTPGPGRWAGGPSSNKNLWLTAFEGQWSTNKKQQNWCLKSMFSFLGLLSFWLRCRRDGVWISVMKNTHTWNKVFFRAASQTILWVIWGDCTILFYI